MTAQTADRTRDAARSRDAILAAAEALFAERGYEPASLSDIGAEAGLSRATPSYFFGSKEQLYAEVLERAFSARHRATEAAFAPVRAWCEADGGLDALHAALTEAADGYIAFLAGQPTFVRLVMREELDGATRLRARPMSTAMQDAFEALRTAGRARGLRPFDVDDAVLLFVALTFAPLAFQNSLMRAFGRDLARSADRRRQVELAVGELMHLLRG